MNARQAAKAAAEHIEQLEDFNRRASQEIKGLNACIDSVIAGEKTYCDWCEERDECDRAEKGTGCKEWWLTMDLELPDGEGDADEGAGILSASPDC